MGLAERRAAKNFQERKWPSLLADIEKAAGFKVLVEVEWETLSEDGYGEQYEEYWTQVYFKPLIEAFKGITFDDMGKEALAEGLEKVVIRYSGSSDVHFRDKIFTIDISPISNVSYWEDRRNEWKDKLEKAL